MAAADCDELVQTSHAEPDVMPTVGPPAAAPGISERRDRRQVGPDSAQWQDGMAEFMGPIHSGDD